MKRAHKTCSYSKCKRIFFRESWHRDSEWRKRKFCHDNCREADYREKNPDRNKPKETIRLTGQYYINHKVIDWFIYKYQPI